MHPRLRRAARLGALAFAAGCSDASGPPPVASISIVAAVPTIRVGDTVALAARMVDDRGGTLPARAVVWRSEMPEVATMVDARLVAHGVGQARVVASADGVEGSSTFVVRSQPVASVAVEPASVHLYAGDSVRLRVTLRDAAGRIVPDVTPRVALAFPGLNEVIRVGADGWVHALSGGGSSIAVTAESARANVEVRVSEHPLVALRAVRRTLVLETGTCFDAGLVGRTVDGRDLAVSASLASGDQSIVAQVAPGNLVPCPRRFVAAAPGTTTLEASFHSLAVTVPVTVVPPLPSEFEPTIRWFGPRNATVDASLVGAIARWRRVIIGDLPDRRLVLAEGACFPGSPAVDEMVDEVLVHVYAGPLDGPGGVLARAGPCATRDDADLPLAGIVMIDAADVGTLESGSPHVERLLMHELGHVLGIGTLWDAHVGGTPADPRFRGPRARLAAGDFGFLPQERDGIEIETGGSGGTAGAHWRETTFGSELMTGWLDERDPTVLSAWTAGVLEDLGFTINHAAVDVVSPPPIRSYANGPVAHRARPEGGIRLHDRPLRPRFTVRADGSARPIAR